jgi:DNA-binding CsgD family transcriptional regulator/tetratricopeptide (TPR) repeat protein
MTRADALEQGQDAFRQRAWGDAFTALSAADRDGALQPDDLRLLARAADLSGRDSDASATWARAHHELVQRGDAPGAARCAFWLGMQLMNRGEMAPAGGWFARAQRLLDEDDDCVEQGYVLVPAALQRLFGGDAATALPDFVRVAHIAERFADPDLLTLSRLGRGQALVTLGLVAEGVALFDEIMIGVTSGEVDPIVAGIAYCAVIEACHEIFDLRRAREWTAALTAWCDSQRDLIPFRGQCLVHRAEIMQLHGAWPAAMDAAQQACERLASGPAAGRAFYQRAELHRLRGEFPEAEEAYRLASQWGHDPQPGLALLRLASGQVAAAHAALRRVMDEAEDRHTRSRMLPAYVQILLATADVAGARTAAEELDEISTGLGAPFLQATSDYATASVLLAEGEPRAALSRLRPAWATLCELEAPYEAARVRALIASACVALGDEDTAAMELDAARGAFEQLGASSDLVEIGAAKTRGGLTAREAQVLALVATGKTNREIASTLVISEHTVARHVQNIFTKLGVSTRTAASKFAFEHDLV